MAQVSGDVVEGLHDILGTFPGLHVEQSKADGNDKATTQVPQGAGWRHEDAKYPVYSLKLPLEIDDSSGPRGGKVGEAHDQVVLELGGHRHEASFTRQRDTLHDEPVLSLFLDFGLVVYDHAVV